MPTFRIVARACSTLLVASTLAAQQQPQSPSIPTSEIDAHIQFLASDLLEGRAPGTRGGLIAEQYVAAQLKSYGIQPGVHGSYYQPVPIDVVNANPASVSVTATGKASATLRLPQDVVVWAGSATPASAAKGELVFVGYGAKAPEYNWDDFKGMDLKGKILLVLVNDPPAPANEPTLFGGKAMTYYGRWVYKFEEAERQGAAGMLVVHNTADAGYPWQVVVTSNSTEHRLLARDPNGPAPIGVRGWIQNEAAAALLKQAGLDLNRLRKQADSRNFKPVATGIMMDLSMTNTVSHLQANNVVGVIPGSDEQLRAQHVLYSAHVDHLGIGPAVNGDSIYNGALDNASGVAVILAVAHASAQAPVKPKRSQLFVFVTAEESGLLGSAYYGLHPTVPTRDIIAGLNVDGGNLLGRVNNLEVLGDSKSSLGPSIAAFIKPDGMTLSPQDHPEAGAFYRSDHFSFAKVGIPSISVGPGNDFVGRPKGWGKQQDELYTEKNYHQPSDEYRADWDLSGAAQLASIVQRFGTSLANAATIPVWNADAEFKAIREQSIRGQ